MARRTRVAVLCLGVLLAVAVSVAFAATEPTFHDVFARARRALREHPAQDPEADSPSLTGVAPDSPVLLALPASPSTYDDPPRAPPRSPAQVPEVDSPSITGVAPDSPALLALPATPSTREDPPRAPPAPPTSQRRALPSGRTSAPTCTFVTYIGGGGAEVAEVVRGGDGRVFVVGLGSTPDRSIAAASHQTLSADAPDSDDSSEEEGDEDGEVFPVVMDQFCQVLGYARTAYTILEWFLN